MQPFRVHSGIVAPLDRANVDTDAIIPKQFLKSIKRSGFGVNLFDAWRYTDRGEPGMDPSLRHPNPDFVLNQPRYRDASILLARRNFGCGSSREHAPQALQRWGIQAIVRESYSEIFFGNSVQLGLPCLTVSPESIERLMRLVEGDPAMLIAVDVAGLNVSACDVQASATMPKAAHEALTTGLWDGTGLLLADFDQVRRLAEGLPYVTGKW